ncbi:hypothetical protein EG830_15020 [bacterium]|nr:hypothetical protein [bacterium]
MVTRHFRIVAFFYLLLIICACISCESGSSSGSTEEEVPISTDDRELIGTWAGWLAFGEGNYLVDFDNNDPNDIFAIGILTLAEEARFIGDIAQFVCYEGSFGVTNYYNVRKNFGGNFYFYTYLADTTGGDYNSSIESVRLEGSTFLTNAYLEGYYVYPPVPNPPTTWWEILFLNYSTSGIHPDVNKLEGTWKIEDAYIQDNTLTFTVTPTSANSDTATIAGTDSRGNIINGTIIEIQYNDTTRNIPATEMYRVSLNLTTTIIPTSTNLTGLATYIESMDSSGVEVQRGMAIGVTSYGSTRMLTGVATKIP